jgi:hypothetical protein
MDDDQEMVTSTRERHDQSVPTFPDVFVESMKQADSFGYKMFTLSGS